MSLEPNLNEIASAETLAPVSDLQEYGDRIIAELDNAEAELENNQNQPFCGMSNEVMRDISQLREEQFDMFRRHVEIEQAYKIQNAVAEANDVQKMSFSGIATTMRKKENATAGLLNKLAEFDAHLRTVMDKFDRSGLADPAPPPNNATSSSGPVIKEKSQIQTTSSNGD